MGRHQQEEIGVILKLIMGSTRHFLRALGYGSFGALIVLLTIFVYTLYNRPELQVWHEAELSEDFTAQSDLQTMEEYLELENVVFQQLDQLVFRRTGVDYGGGINRFQKGSLSDPERWPRNWNRSFELIPKQPTAAVLLIHGMSDSPYSMRSIAEQLHQSGARVLGLRLPGHGTAPSGLLDARWEDMAAAVRLAVPYLAREVAGRPLFIVGYSHGAALTLTYALETLEDESLPRVDGLVLLSPEIAISKLAAFAIWQARLGRLLGLEKLAWNSIMPEYDPFKHGSFALNAAIQAYRITGHVNARISALADSGSLAGMPPVLAFQSAVDATVLAPALVTGLFNRLQVGGHELVIFDINRYTNIEDLLKGDPTSWLDGLRERQNTPFSLSLLANTNEWSQDLNIHQSGPGNRGRQTCVSGLRWPGGLFSLSHVALPFPADDPLYGNRGASSSPGIYLGMLALRGEHNVLRVSPAEMLRLRWNPFHRYMVSRIGAFMHLSQPADLRCTKQ